MNATRLYPVWLQPSRNQSMVQPFPPKHRWKVQPANPTTAPSEEQLSGRCHFLPLSDLWNNTGGVWASNKPGDCSLKIDQDKQCEEWWQKQPASSLVAGNWRAWCMFTHLSAWHLPHTCFCSEPRHLRLTGFNRGKSRVYSVMWVFIIAYIQTSVNAAAIKTHLPVTCSAFSGSLSLVI